MKEPVSCEEFEEVMLTGATGFIGRFMLRELLLQKPNLIVHCLVRSENQADGFTRIQTAMLEANIWKDEFLPRIQIISGDVTRPRLGLGNQQFVELCNRLHAVYHFVADLSLSTSYQSLTRTNIDGTCHVLELCLLGRFKHFFFSSTLGIFPEYFYNFANELQDHSIGHQVFPKIKDMERLFPLGILGYSWTKLVIELGLIYARSMGLPVAIYRFPRTNIASSGMVKHDDIVGRILASIIDVGLTPRHAPGFVSLSNEPVDTLSEICTAISLNDSRKYVIYNLFNERDSRLIFEYGDFGYDVREVSYNAFKQACLSRGKQSPLDKYWTLIDTAADYWFSPNQQLGKNRISIQSMQEDCPRPVNWPGLIFSYRNNQQWINLQGSDWPLPQPRSNLSIEFMKRRASEIAGNMEVSPKTAYPDWMLEALEVYVDANKRYEDKIPNHQLTYIILGITMRLRNIAAVTRLEKLHPEILNEPVKKPLFIVGIHRTGTTFLHRLMSRDPQFWSLRVHEMVEPIPLSHDLRVLLDEATDPRFEFASDLVDVDARKSLLLGFHHFDMNEAEEDFALLGMCFTSWASHINQNLPEYRKWLEKNDFHNAYAFHRRLIKHYTWQRRRYGHGSGDTWLLKMPFHLREIKALLTNYPDACIIQTHRNPEESLVSWLALVHRIQQDAVDPQSKHEIGMEQLEFVSETMNNAIRFREQNPEFEDQWVDISYREFVENPFVMMDEIYDQFGLSLGDEARHAMQAWYKKQSTKRQKEVRQQYNLDDFGITQKQILKAFAPYLDYAESRGLIDTSQ